MLGNVGLTGLPGLPILGRDASECNMNRQLILAWPLLVLAMIVLTACGSTVTVEEPSALIEPLDARNLGYRVRWISSTDVPDDARITHTKVMDDVLITIEYPANIVTAVSIRDGSLLWRRMVADKLDRVYEPIRYEDKLVISSQNRIYLVDVYDGQLSGLQNLDFVAASPPSQHDNFLIFGGVNGRVFAHDLETGYARWQYQMASEVVAKPLIIAGQYVFAADTVGVYAMLNVRDGSLIWKGSAFDRISAAPAENRLGVLVASEDYTLYSLDRNSGTDRWKYRATGPLTDAPWAFENQVYLPVKSGGLVALGALRGEVQWKLEEYGEPVTQDRGVLTLKRPRSIWFVEAATGEVLKQAPTAPLRSVLPGPDDSLILLGYDGRVIRLDPAS